MLKRINKDFRYLSLTYICGDGARGLSKNAELIARRVIELLIRSEGHRLPNDFQKIQNAIGGGLSPLEFTRASAEIRNPDFGIFDVSEDGKWLYSKRLLEYFEHRAQVSAKRREAGRKGGLAKKPSGLEHIDVPVTYRRAKKPAAPKQPTGSREPDWESFHQMQDEDRQNRS